MTERIELTDTMGDSLTAIAYDGLCELNVEDDLGEAVSSLTSENARRLGEWLISFADREEGR